MMNRARCTYVCFATVLSLGLFVRYTRAADTSAPLLKALPAWTKVAVRLDLREENPSAKYLRTLGKGEKIEGLRNLGLGLVQAALMDLGANLDVERDLLPWIGNEIVVAIDPPIAKEDKQRFLLLASVKDQSAAARFSDTMLTSLKKKMPNDITSEPAGGTTIWMIGQGKDRLNLALASGALGLSDKAETLRDWLSGKADDAVVARTETAFGKTRSSLATVYVDQSLITRPEVLPANNPLQEFLKVRSVVAGIGVTENGARLEATIHVSEGSGLAQLAKSIPPPTAKALAAIPVDAVAVATMPQPDGLLNGLPLPADPVSIISSFGGPALNHFTADVIAGLIKSEPVAAVTSVAKVPGVIVSLAIEKEETAQKAFQAIRAALSDVKEVSLAPETIGQNSIKITTLNQPDTPPFYFAQQGSFLLASSTKDALQKALDTMAGKMKSIADSPDYKRVASQTQGKPLVGIYINPTRLIRQAAAAAFSEGEMRNKYLEKAAELLSSGFPSLAISTSIEPDAAHLIVDAGVDYKSLRAQTEIALPLVALGFAQKSATQPEVRFSLKRLLESAIRTR